MHYSELSSGNIPQAKVAEDSPEPTAISGSMTWLPVIAAMPNPIPAPIPAQTQVAAM